MLNPLSLTFIIGAGIPVFLLLILICWVKGNRKSLEQNQDSFLNSIAIRYSGRMLSKRVEFSFDGINIQAFLSHPVDLGSAEFQQVIPGFFALQCTLPADNSQKDSLIIKNEQQLRGLPIQEFAIEILKNNFHEIEMNPGYVQIRKLNIVLTEENKSRVLKELNLVIPPLARMMQLIAPTTTDS